jgi:hypothetical protein
MLKKDSQAWQLAVKRSRRKHANSTPIELLADGTVRMQSLIRGNTWVYTLDELKALS